MAYRMLGSLGEVDDAVQEAWLRLSRSDTSAVENRVISGSWVAMKRLLDVVRGDAPTSKTA